MTLFAGIMAFDGSRVVPQALAQELAALISRHPGDEVKLVLGEGFALAQLDLGILPGRGAHADGAGAFSFLAGTPLLAGAPGNSSRDQQLAVLHESWKRGDLAALRSARGSFCAVHVHPVERRLSLVADKLGLRPIYYVEQDGFLFFSTALRVLESLGAIEKRMDLRGVAEIATLGYPLGTRSPYAGMRTIGTAEIVDVAAAELGSRGYWRWDNLGRKEAPQSELTRALYETFTDAVRVRLGAQGAVVAFLSGGLDSRCIVASLRQLGVRVDTVNFAPEGSADLVLGRMCAARLGTRHFEYPAGPHGFWDRMLEAHHSWIDQASPNLPDRPRVLWSGDGGSCALGHIYLTEEMVVLMRSGRTGEAVQKYLARNGAHLSRHLFAPAQRERVRGLPRAGALEEIARLACADEGRKLHVFLMLNGQRRLLAQHYENIDLRRFELEVPFFDSQLLEVVLASPIDAYMGHKLYHRWLKEFQPEASEVAWQAYPGHEPCPVPQPSSLRYQWDAWYTVPEARAAKAARIAAIDDVLNDPHFPSSLLDRRILLLARWLTRLGLGDYSYLFGVAQTFARYAKPKAQ